MKNNEISDRALRKYELGKKFSAIRELIHDTLTELHNENESLRVELADLKGQSGLHHSTPSD